MSDIVSPEVRSRMMSGIRGKNTKPELLVRKQLHSLGYRYILHDARKPGKPDLVFPKYHAVIFVNGCFWHGHDCHFFRWPETRREFWRTKIESNRRNDVVNFASLKNDGWRIATVWECALKGRKRLFLDYVINEICVFLHSDKEKVEIKGRL
jgi:DNA mismatch endonuclease (patch repair protein)